MKQSKVWLVLGASAGLGRPAVSYLLANKQKVIPVSIAEGKAFHETLCSIAKSYGPLDFIINNSNYDLLHKNNPDIGGSVAATVSLLSSLTPYLRQEPRGSIINIPPQLCLVAMADPLAGAKLLAAMNTFLKALRAQLITLNCGLRFLEPGERLL